MKETAAQWAVMLGVIIAVALAGMLARSIFSGPSSAPAYSSFMRGYGVGFCVAVTLGEAAQVADQEEMGAATEACTCATDRLAASTPPGTAPDLSDEQVARIRQECGLVDTPPALLTDEDIFGE